MLRNDQIVNLGGERQGRVPTFGFNQPQINRMYADKRDEEAGFGDVSSLKTVRAQSYPFFHLHF
jgi:hypothetical protein